MKLNMFYINLKKIHMEKLPKLNDFGKTKHYLPARIQVNLKKKFGGKPQPFQILIPRCHGSGVPGHCRCRHDVDVGPATNFFPFPQFLTIFKIRCLITNQTEKILDMLISQHKTKIELKIIEKKN